ncbi:MAG: precorrin-6y C5,15-methyltransferase (decarboxylating) subunit CbiE [Cyanobacteria bacterium P01_H01_bin.15]
MNPIDVVGVGLAGPSELVPSLQKLLDEATLVVGSERLIAHCQHYSAQTQSITDFQQLKTLEFTDCDRVVILASGDPLFFGIGRLLLKQFPPETLRFHPHVSSVQLAFSRAKLPWQDAKIISVHGRPLTALTQVVQKDAPLIAVLTDHRNTPANIARHVVALARPSPYECWVCRNLGGVDETLEHYPQLTEDCSLLQTDASSLNVLILRRTIQRQPIETGNLPLFGLPDHLFASFPDRPGLITKREMRSQILSELALAPSQTIWDIGAGTGSIAIEIARLCPSSQIYATEKTAIGQDLIAENCDRFQVKNVSILPQSAPENLHLAPDPDRVFIGGSGGQLSHILEICQRRLKPDGILLLALATLENLHLACDALKSWPTDLTHLQFSKSLPVGPLTRLNPLNPVFLLRSQNRAR